MARRKQHQQMEVDGSRLKRRKVKIKMEEKEEGSSKMNNNDKYNCNISIITRISPFCTILMQLEQMKC